MPATVFPRLAGLLLAASITLEITVLAGIINLGTVAYNLQHMALLMAILVMQGAIYRHARAHDHPHAVVALLFTLGTASTLVGDVINGGLTPIGPVSVKLSWALLWFGLGYGAYVLAMGRVLSQQLCNEVPWWRRWRYLPVPVILVVNVLSWYGHVYPRVEGHALLTYGSFVFNATLYVLMPLFALWYVALEKASAKSLAVLVGAIWIPYSDLVLFDTWLRNGDIAVASTELFAINWIVYFGGQCLLGMFPAFVLMVPPDRLSTPHSR